MIYYYVKNNNLHNILKIIKQMHFKRIYFIK